MPYDTPYNRMIANERKASDRAYSDINAYSNQLYNGRGRFDEARIRFPDRDGTTIHNTALIRNPDDSRHTVDIGGGVTHRNMEGSAGVMPYAFRHIGRGEDMKGCGKDSDEGSGSESDEGSECSDGEMEGDGFFGDLWDKVKGVAKSAISNPGDTIEKGKQVYDVGKKAFDMFKAFKGRGESGGAQNMSLSIKPFASPKEQAVARNNEMTSGPIGGGKGKKTSTWIDHVKAFAKSKGMNYRDALRSAECKASYKKTGKGTSGGSKKRGAEDDTAKLEAITKGMESLPQMVKEAPKGLVKPIAVKKGGRKYKGGSVIGGPHNDPVNRGKITGLGRKGKKTGSALFVPKGEFPLTQKTTDLSQFNQGMEGKGKRKGKKIGGASTEFPQKFNKTTGHKWEGATLGAGVSAPKRRVLKGAPSDMPIITPADIKRVRGKGKLGADPKTYTPKKGGMLKQQMKSSTVSGTGLFDFFRNSATENIAKNMGYGKKKVSAVRDTLQNPSLGDGTPFEYPSSDNIKGYGKRKRGDVKRTDVVKRIMAVKGMKLGEASKYVKEHKLFEKSKDVHMSGGNFLDTLGSIVGVAGQLAPLLSFL